MGKSYFLVIDEHSMAVALSPGSLGSNEICMGGKLRGQRPRD